MPPVDPSNGGLSLSPLPGDVSVRSGQQMAYATRSGMFVSFLEFQVGSCLYVTAAVKAASHFGRAQGDQSGQSNSRVHWDPSPPQVHTHSTYMFNEVRLGFLMRFGLIAFRPLHLVSLFILFLFSFMSFCLHVLSSHPFFRLRTHRSWP